jgi:N-acetylglucosaminyldiphosphoundecaprenol N-acetyl-beta-D-mannosaminyltransferase
VERSSPADRVGGGVLLAKRDPELSIERERGTQVTARTNVIGVGISAVNMPLALEAIDRWVIGGARQYVCVAAAHSVMECRRDVPLRRLFNQSGLTTPDGMPLVWLSRLAGHREVRRVYGPELMLAVCKSGLEKGYRHFFYGGAAGVAEDLVDRLRLRFPHLAVAGTSTPPFRDLSPEEDEMIDRQINDSGADIVWIGVGTGRQERWMGSHRTRLQAPVLVGVGAAFDFLSGTKAQAPPWIRGTGLEWLYRLAHEPRRLWPRYREYPLFVLLVAAQRLHLRRYPLDP